MVGVKDLSRSAVPTAVRGRCRCRQRGRGARSRRGGYRPRGTRTVPGDGRRDRVHRPLRRVAERPRGQIVRHQRQARTRRRHRVTSLLLGAVSGIAAARRFAVGAVGFVGFGAVGLWAYLRDPLGTTGTGIAAAIAAVLAGVAALAVLLRLAADIRSVGDDVIDVFDVGVDARRMAGVVDGVAAGGTIVAAPPSSMDVGRSGRRDSSSVRPCSGRRCVNGGVRPAVAFVIVGRGDPSECRHSSSGIIPAGSGLPAVRGAGALAVHHTEHRLLPHRHRAGRSPKSTSGHGGST